MWVHPFSLCIQVKCETAWTNEPGSLFWPAHLLRMDISELLFAPFVFAIDAVCLLVTNAQTRSILGLRSLTKLLNCS